MTLLWLPPVPVKRLGPDAPKFDATYPERRYVTNETQRVIIEARAEADYDDHDKYSGPGFLSFDLCETQCEPLSTVGDEWQCDLTYSGGPCIMGTREQLDTIGVWHLLYFYPDVIGWASVCDELAEAAWRVGCFVMPWTPDDVAKLAYRHESCLQAARCNNGVMSVTEDDASRLAMRAVLAEVAQMRRSWSGSDGELPAIVVEPDGTPTQPVRTDDAPLRSGLISTERVR